VSTKSKGVLKLKLREVSKMFVKSENKNPLARYEPVRKSLE
jgi:hypothetical protein